MVKKEALSVKAESALFVFDVYQYVLNLAVKNCAKVVQGNGAYWLVVFQSVNEASAQTECVDKPVG